MELSDYRAQIDRIDAELLQLFAERMQTAAGIAAYKKSHGLPVLDAGREREKLAQIVKAAPEDLQEVAFAEDKLDRETALKIASGFGGGMAGMRDVCGAVSGMFMAYGLLCGPADPTDRAAKTNNYAALRQLAGEFEARNGSIICRQLLGLDPNFKPQPPEPRTDSYYKKRPCPEMVFCAADILETYLAGEAETPTA